ncbi:hypothetical protein HYPSUDRAFT_42078 [Hypholoma sublateritium FD-334 SS-4]|uniref:Uncharacterized protein n=1 Tax=Hypholoma sublateritium (strain FD-334 SS-4) TaxID=945553 RepID=A0A0D2MD33_HYPSF|nr:hypothetical protein HYPSUDRAFT_42078 [Hypholoma sublateritium FD-334 SS-4]
MVFRLPSQLETLVPPPYDQRTQPPPWRGSIVVSGMRSSDRGSNQQIQVTAVETDGEKAQQWPSAFYATVLHDQPVLGEFRAWMKTLVHPLPLCTFMPNRLRDVNLNTVNQTTFRSLSSMLHENQAVAVASWAPNTFIGSGMVIYPSSNSSAVLIGALFFDTSFPPFIGYVSSPVSPISSLAMQPSRHGPYQQRVVAVPPYDGSSPHRHAPSLSPHRSDHNSPIEQPIAAHRQEHYHRYNVPRPGHPGYADLGQASSSQIGWTSNVKTEDENNYSSYPSHQNPPYP